jgi:hypothetical protein
VFSVALATALVTTTALPAAAANGYEAGFVKAVDHISLERRSDDLHRVGNGRHRDRDYYRGDRGRYRGDRGHRHGHHGKGYRERNVYIVPSHRFYGRPYRPHRYYDRYYYDDYLGVFLLGGALGYILNE